MNQSTIQKFFSLLGSAIFEDVPGDNEIISIKEDELISMIALAKKHDLLHLFALGLDQNKLLENCQVVSQKDIMKAIYRYEQLNYELGNLCKSLEESKIDFMPLKGSVIRKYYPNPWMRTSCDIDILVHERDLEKATEYLLENLGYVFDGKGAHDVSLFLEKRLHLELHYTLIGDGVAKSSCKVLKEVWKSSFLRKGKEHWHEMTDEMFYFYHIAHMAKHFEEGGCGIRPFIDLWILDNIEKKDQDKRNELLKQGALLKFSEVARQLSKVWFDNAEHTEITEQMEQYILRGGVYGTNENRITVQQQKKGGRIKYILSKIFIPYDVIKFHYPILQKHIWLTPFMEIRRWFKLIFCGHAKRTLNEFKYNQTISVDKAEATKKFLENIGL